MEYNLLGISSPVAQHRYSFARSGVSLSSSRCLLFIVLSMGLSCAGGCSHQDKFPAQTQNATLQATFVPVHPRVLDTVFINVVFKPAPATLPHTMNAMLSMSSMDMGHNTIKLTATSKPGQYAGTFQFTMAGNWTVTIADPTSKATRLLQADVDVQ